MAGHSRAARTFRKCPSGSRLLSGKRRRHQARQEDESARQLAQTEALCRDMLAQAEESAAYYWQALQQKVEEFIASRTDLAQPQPADGLVSCAEEHFGPDD